MEQNIVHPNDDGREILDLDGNPQDAAARWRYFDHLSWKYKMDRKAEYPPIEEYIDGVVKGDQAQIQAYIDACIAIKEKYPKPE
jgi:hypothetical protein